MTKFEKRQNRLDSLTLKAIKSKNKIKRGFWIGVLKLAKIEMKYFMKYGTV